MRARFSQEDYEQQLREANDEQAFWLVETGQEPRPESRIEFLKREHELVMRCMERYRERRKRKPSRKVEDCGNLFSDDYIMNFCALNYKHCEHLRKPEKCKYRPRGENEGK